MERTENEMRLLKESLLLSSAGIFTMQLQSIFGISWFISFSILAGGAGIFVYDLLDKEDNFEKLFKSMEFQNAKKEIPQLEKKIKTSYGHDYIFALPAGMSLKMFEKAKMTIEQYLDSKINLEYKENKIIIKSSDIKLKEKYPYRFVKTDHPLDIYIGHYAEGLKNIKIKQNALICGTSGSGKSTLCRALNVSLILNSTPSQLVLNHVDFKRTELGIFKNSKFVNTFCVEIPEYDKLMARLEKESKRRYTMFEEKNVLDIDRWNAKYEPMKYIVTFIDEIAQLGSPKESKQSEVRFNMLQRRLSYDRAAGMYYIISTQRPSVDIITGSIKANIDIRISFKTVDSTNSWIVLDDEQAAQYLTCPGRGLLKETNELIEFQAPYLSEDEAIKLVKHTFINKKKEEQNDNGEGRKDNKIPERKGKS